MKSHLTIYMSSWNRQEKVQFKQVDVEAVGNGYVLVYGKREENTYEIALHWRELVWLLYKAFFNV